MPQFRLPTQRKVTLEGLLWVVLALGLYLLTFDFDQELREYELGAATWPRFMIIMIGLGGIGLAAVQTRRGNSASAGPSVAHVDDTSSAEFLPETVSKKTDLKRLLTFGLPLIYVFSMHYLGFLLVSPFFLIAYMYLFGYRKWRILFYVNITVYVIVLIIFIKLLYTHLPPGLGIFHNLNGEFIDLVQ